MRMGFRWVFALTWGFVVLAFHSMSVCILLGLTEDGLNSTGQLRFFLFFCLFLLPFDVITVGAWRFLIRDIRLPGSNDPEAAKLFITWFSERLGRKTFLINP